MKTLISTFFVLLLMGRRGVCLAPYYMEYYANYHDFHNDDKVSLMRNILFKLTRKSLVRIISINCCMAE